MCHATNYWSHSWQLVALPIRQCVKCLIIKLAIQVVTAVSNHNKAYNRHTWVGTNHRLTNHRSDRLSQNATAQSGAWEARHTIPDCISPDRLSQGALQKGTEKKRLQKPKISDKLSCNRAEKSRAVIKQDRRQADTTSKQPRHIRRLGKRHKTYDTQQSQGPEDNKKMQVQPTSLLWLLHYSGRMWVVNPLHWCIT